MMRLAEAIVALLAPAPDSRPIDVAWNNGLSRYVEDDDATEPDSAPSRRFDEDEDTEHHKLTPETALLLAEAAGERGSHDAQAAYVQYANTQHVRRGVKCKP